MTELLYSNQLQFEPSLRGNNSIIIIMWDALFYRRVHLMLLSLFFIGQYAFSFLYQQTGTCFEGIICDGYTDCVYFEWLFYYTHIIFPGINVTCLIIWLYIMFMCPECFPGMEVCKIFI